MKTTSWINVTILLTLLALSLQTAGFVAPMWIWLDVDSFKVGVGLWFTSGCGLEGTCNAPTPNVSFGYTTDDTFSKPQFNAVRGLETAAVAGTVLLLLFIFVYRFGYGKWTNMEQLNTAAFLTSIVIWLCILAGLIVYCAYYWPVVGTSPLINTQSFPWSLVMCLFAAFFFILVSVLIRVKCRDRAYLKDAIPIAGDANTEQYPVTKHGLLHRYFVPLYRGIRGQNQNPAIGYQSEAKTVHNLNTRLVEAEERHHVAAIDNAAFYADNRVSEANAANLRYLHNQTGQAVTHNQQTETVIRRSLPTAIVTYTDATANDSRHLHSQTGAAARLYEMDHQAQRAAADRDLMFRHVDDAKRDVAYRDGGVSTYQVGGIRRDVIDQHVDVRTHDVIDQRGGMRAREVMDQRGGTRAYDAMERQDGFMAKQQSGVTTRDQRERMTRDVVMRDVTEHQGGVSPRHAAYQAGGVRSDVAAQDLANQTGTEATRSVIHQFGGGEAYLREGHARNATHQSGDMVTRDIARGRGAAFRDASGNDMREERVTTTTTTTYVTEEGREKRGGLKVTEVASQDGDGTLQYVSGRLSSWASSDSVRPYDPTYIYRPYSETV